MPSTTLRAARAVLRGVWRSTISRAGRLDAWATAAKAPIPRAAIFFSSQTSTRMVGWAAAIARARSASCCGPSRLGGMCCRSRARFTASAATAARRPAAPAARSCDSSTSPVGGFGPVGRLRRLEAVEPVAADDGAVDRAAGRHGGVHRQPIQHERERAAAHAGQAAHRGAGRVSHRLGVGRRPLAEADDRHPARTHALSLGVQHGHLAGCAPDLAGLHQPPDGAAERAIELRDGALQGDRLGDGNGQHVDVGRRRRCRGGGDLHGSSLWSGEGTAQGYPTALMGPLIVDRRSTRQPV